MDQSMPIVAEAGAEEAEPRRKAEGRFHHGDLRTSLLAMASQVVAERGSMDVSLRELARALGVTHAATYRHFASKADLMAALALRAARRLDALVAGVLSSRDGTATERLREAGETYVAFARANPGAYRTMADPDLARADEAAALREALAGFGRTLADAVAEGQAEGALRRGPTPDVAAATILAAWHGLVATTVIAGLDEDAARPVVDSMLDLIAAGLTATPGVTEAEAAPEAPVAVENAPAPAKADKAERKDGKEKRKPAPEPMMLDLFG